MDQKLQLYYLNLGSYIPKIFGEFHRYSFHIADSAKNAAVAAARTSRDLPFTLTGKHTDDMIRVWADTW